VAVILKDMVVEDGEGGVSLTVTSETTPLFQVDAEFLLSGVTSTGYSGGDFPFSYIDKFIPGRHGSTVTSSC
jgi:hypothetical protein